MRIGVYLFIGAWALVCYVLNLSALGGLIVVGVGVALLADRGVRATLARWFQWYSAKIDAPGFAAMLAGIAMLLLWLMGTPSWLMIALLAFYGVIFVGGAVAHLAVRRQWHFIYLRFPAVFIEVCLTDWGTEDA